MLTESQKQILSNNLALNGPDVQTIKFIEECAEAIAILSKREAEGKIDYEGIYKELADVMVTLYQVILIYGRPQVTKALNCVIDDLKRKNTRGYHHVDRS